MPEVSNELADALRRIENALSLHTPVDLGVDEDGEPRLVCNTCECAAPCPTARALDETRTFEDGSR
jgi:hypothetical protein